MAKILTAMRNKKYKGFRIHHVYLCFSIFSGGKKVIDP